MEIGALTKAKGRLVKGTPSDDVRAELGALHAWSSTKDADRDETMDESKRDVSEPAGRSGEKGNDLRDMCETTSERDKDLCAVLPSDDLLVYKLSGRQLRDFPAM